MPKMNPELHAQRARLVNRLLKAQARHDMTDAELASLVGVHSSSPSGWRNGAVPTGDRVPNIQAAIKLLNETPPGDPVRTAPARSRANGEPAPSETGPLEAAANSLVGHLVEWVATLPAEEFIDVLERMMTARRRRA